MKRWIAIGTVLAALGASIAIAGCAADGSSTCDLSQCTYTMNGSQYACNECGIGGEVYNCDTIEGCFDCGIGCTGTCITNCARENCSECGNVPTCSYDGCALGSWVEVELTEPDHYSTYDLYVLDVSGQQGDQKYVCNFYMYLYFNDNYQNVYVDLEIVYDGVVIGTVRPHMERSDDKIRNFSCPVSAVDGLLELTSYECREQVTIRIVKVTAEAYVEK